jgi:hypothetical protein
MKTLAIFLLVLIVLWLVSERRTPTSPISILYRQAARYAVASSQDEAAIIKVLHANYAMGDLLALKDIASSTEFTAATGKDLLEFEHEIVRIQDAATLALVKTCPDLAPQEKPQLLQAMYA